MDSWRLSKLTTDAAVRRVVACILVKALVMIALAAAFFYSVDLSAASVQRRRAPRESSTQAPSVRINDDFRFGAQGWAASFSDYAPIQENIMEFDSGIRSLPAELGSGTAYFISANNRSDDVFMFLVRKLTEAEGIRANKRYQVSFRILLGSNAPGNNCAGIGGHPGFSVYLKAGATSVEPRSVLMASGFVMNVDKGNQSTGGPAATVAGDVSTGTDVCSNAPFATLERIHRHTFSIDSNASGELWLLVGTDSGFEGKTSLYYQSISATLTALP